MAKLEQLHLHDQLRACTRSQGPHTGGQPKRARAEGADHEEEERAAILEAQGAAKRARTANTGDSTTPQAESAPTRRERAAAKRTRSSTTRHDETYDETEQGEKIANKRTKTDKGVT